MAQEIGQPAEEISGVNTTNVSARLGRLQGTQWGNRLVGSGDTITDELDGAISEDSLDSYQARPTMPPQQPMQPRYSDAPEAWRAASPSKEP